MAGHAVVIADVAIVERRAGQDIIGSHAGGLHSRTIEVRDQHRLADWFLSQRQVVQVERFSWIRLYIRDFSASHPYEALN